MKWKIVAVIAGVVVIYFLPKWAQIIMLIIGLIVALPFYGFDKIRTYEEQEEDRDR